MGDDWPTSERSRVSRDAMDALDGTARYVEHGAGSGGRPKLPCRCNDGELVEAVRDPVARRRTVCVSSQVGLRVGAHFAAAAWAGSAQP